LSLAAAPQHKPPGWRGRIGIIQPSPGVMLEYEWPRWLPDEVLFPVARVRMAEASAAGYRGVVEQAPAAATELARAGAGVVAFACTIGSLFEGAAAEQELVERMAQASSLPALSLGSTSVLALRAVGASRVAVLTPYSKAVNAWVKDYLVAHGIGVAGFIATPADIVTVGNLPAAEIAEIAIRGMQHLADADALWIPCTAIRTLEAIEMMEGRTGSPAISASQALLWHSLEILGLAGAGQPCGRLFQTT
jgi:maleate cis-trans isomerase